MAANDDQDEREKQKVSRLPAGAVAFLQSFSTFKAAVGVILLQIHSSRERRLFSDMIRQRDQFVASDVHKTTSKSENARRALPFIFLLPLAHFSARLPLGIYFIARNQPGSRF
jgi:hypothetical protein